MTDDSRAKISKLTNTVDSDMYVGSTTDTLKGRFWKHRHEQRHSRSGSIRVLAHVCLGRISSLHDTFVACRL